MNSKVKIQIKTELPQCVVLFLMMTFRILRYTSATNSETRCTVSRCRSADSGAIRGAVARAVDASRGVAEVVGESDDGE